MTCLPMIRHLFDIIIVRVESDGNCCEPLNMQSYVFNF